jgi:hypothetical protein
MLVGGTQEFKSMMHQFYPTIYKGVIKFWWTNYVEEGMDSSPPDVDLVEFGLRHIGELFRTNEFVADLSNGYHLIKRREKTTQNLMDGDLADMDHDDVVSIDEAFDASSEDSEGDEIDDDGEAPKKKSQRARKRIGSEAVDIEVDDEGEDDGTDPDVCNIVRHIETLYADAAKFEGEASANARQVWHVSVVLTVFFGFGFGFGVGFGLQFSLGATLTECYTLALQVILAFFSTLAQASSAIPMTGIKLQRALKNLRNIEAESALGSAGLHATIGVLHLNGVYTVAPPPSLHENINTKANQLANVIPYTAKVYETNQVSSIDRIPIWGSDAFIAVAEGLKAPIVRAQLAKEDIIGVTFRYVIVVEPQAVGTKRPYC